jgi:hypothetical protein
VFGYSLFGIYAITVAPFVTKFITNGERNLFLAIFGFTMLVLEFFALNFKLRMIKMRSEQKRIAYEKETGKEIIPSVGLGVFFGFCMRLVFRAAIIMVSMTALGFECNEEKMSVPGEIATVIGVLVDILSVGYMYVKSQFYTDPPQNRKEFAEDIKDEDDWYKENAELSTSVKYFRYEIIADIILQVFALILFTSFWKYINNSGIEILHNCIKYNKPSDEAFMKMFFMMFAMVVLGLMPMRIAYWIEDSMEAFTTREKTGMWITFFIAAIYTCSPAIIKYISLFILHQPEYQPSSTLAGYAIAFGSYIAIMIVQIIIYGKKQDDIKIT